MKRKVLRVLQVSVFCGLLALVLAGVSRIVERKASRIRLEPFLEHAQEMDVLFIGDSHMVNGVFPMELWTDYGIASYNLSSYGNTIPVSYWALRNALDYASPELVVIGIKDVNRTEKLTGSSSDVHTAFDGYPISRTKIAAIEDLMDDPYAEDDDGNRYAEMKWEYLFTLGKYHSRWNELQASDFHYSLSRQKGAEMIIGVADPRDYDIIDEDQMMEEEGWGFVYLRRMVEECRQRGIEVLLVHLPYPPTEANQLAANLVGSIAQEYEVNYIDFVNLDQVVDYEVDCYDSYSHLNPSGARKVTDYLGRYITEHYQVPDHRGEAAYSAWNEEANAYLKEKLERVVEQKNARNALMLLHDADFSVCVSLKKGSSFYEDEKVMTLMQNLAREHVFEEDAFSKWSNALFPLTELDAAAAEEEAYFLLADRRSGGIIERAGAQEEETIETSFGEWTYSVREGRASLRMDGGVDILADSEAEMQIVVIDNQTGQIAAQLRFDQEGMVDL